MQHEEEPELSQFDYCGKVDLHALDSTIDLYSVVAIAAEHGFRGIVVPLSRAELLLKYLKEQNSIQITPICTVDYPLGALSLDVRNYCIMSAKEKGIREVEIVAPYHFIVDRDFRSLDDDARSLMATAKKAGIKIKYVLDQNSPYFDDDVRAKVSRMIKENQIPVVSTSLGFFDKSSADHADNVIKMRALKTRGGCEIKVYIPGPDVNDLASYVKAGADIIGLPWNKAANLVHAYENMVENKD
jgi:deoxyribose-phosphate aldolase